MSTWLVLVSLHLSIQFYWNNKHSNKGDSLRAVLVEKYQPCLAQPVPKIHGLLLGCLRACWPLGWDRQKEQQDGWEWTRVTDMESVAWSHHYLGKLERKALKNSVRIWGVPGSVTNDDFKVFCIWLPTNAWNTTGQQSRGSRSSKEASETSELNPITLNVSIPRQF